MKGLLHSKKFRTNLYKWLLMYVGVMGLLTTLITYSKYISSMQADDNARAAKFLVKVSNDTGCRSGSTDDVCKVEANRPLEPTVYTFTVDKTDLEVSTTLITSLFVDKRFDLVSIYVGNNDVTSEFTSSGNVDNGKYYHKTETIKANDKENRTTTYKIKVKYNVIEDKYDDTNLEINAVSIGYSATQIK